MTTLRNIENLGYCLTDTICVFCSRTYSENPIVCSCGEYKGVMNIAEAVKYYGIDILPV